MIHPTAVIDRGAEIGEGVYIWHFCHIMSQAKIGDQSSLGQNVVMLPNSSLGKGCRVQNNVTLYTGVHCSDYVFLGPSCVFTNVINPRAFIPRKDQFRKTFVGEGASIGANATIICGNSIGAYAMIGAGAVVTQSVPPYALVVGNPARQIGWISRAGHRLDFDTTGVAYCPETGERYLLDELEAYDSSNIHQYIGE